MLAALAGLSFVLLLWQWIVARRFPLHRRVAEAAFAPGVTLLKPIKGCDPATADCLRSWLAQSYAGPVQVLFGIAEPTDPAGDVVRRVIAEFPPADAELVICPEALGANAKVSKLIQLARRAKHGVIIVSDADVRVPPDFLGNVLAPLREPAVGLVNCFYRLANPVTLAMRWEAVAINADFWSQVLQSRSLKPLDFALGAVMVARREALASAGGFAALADYLADDYQLGHRIAAAGWRIELCPVVVECWDPPTGWGAVWKHQLRWARTIRVCQPAAYFFSLLSNATLWPLAWLAAHPTAITAVLALGMLAIRGVAAIDLQIRLTRARPRFANLGLVFLKDLLQVALWFGAFAGTAIQWRGQRYRLSRDGRLTRVAAA